MPRCGFEGPGRSLKGEATAASDVQSSTRRATGGSKPYCRSSAVHSVAVGAQSFSHAGSLTISIRAAFTSFNRGYPPPRGALNRRYAYATASCSTSVSRSHDVLMVAMFSFLSAGVAPALSPTHHALEVVKIPRNARSFSAPSAQTLSTNVSRRPSVGTDGRSPAR